jgi:outer membrane protein TolC
VLARVEQNVAATRYAYDHGATSLLDLLDALRAAQDVSTEYYTALHDYWIAVYAVEAAEGVRP